LEEYGYEMESCGVLFTGMGNLGETERYLLYLLYIAGYEKAWTDKGRRNGILDGNLFGRSHRKDIYLFSLSGRVIAILLLLRLLFYFYSSTYPCIYFSGLLLLETILILREGIAFLLNAILFQPPELFVAVFSAIEISLLVLLPSFHSGFKKLHLKEHLQQGVSSRDKFSGAKCSYGKWALQNCFQRSGESDNMYHLVLMDLIFKHSS